MNKIQELRATKFALQRHINELTEQIYDLEIANVLPNKKLEYEGKFYKMKNSYGRDSKSWWLYTYVHEVNDLSYFTGTTFELCENGNIDITFTPYQSLNLLGKEISQEEYEEAVTNLHKEVKSRLFLYRKQ